MYIHLFVCVCESQRRFSPLLSLKYLYISFFTSVCLSLPAPCLLPCSSSVPPPPLPRREAIRPSLRSSFPAFPPLVLRSCSCRVFRGCRVSPVVSPWLVPSCLLCVCALEAPRRPSVCRAACLLLVSYQAQNAMTVGADAPRVCPRPYLLLSVMCCRCSFRVSRCPFRCLFRCLSCLLSSVRVCVLLPAVVWWQ